MITVEQIKAARKLLGWSYATLAKKSCRGLSAIAAIEAGEPLRGAEKALARIQRALEAAGVEFLNHGAPGVRLNPERAMAYATERQREAEEGLNLRDSPEPGVTTNRRRSVPGEET